MESIDLNCDLGETETNRDAEIMPFLSSCNIACGGHAGNRTIMYTAVKTALTHRVKVGAHPSYPDRDNFGRKSLDLPRPTLLRHLQQQIQSLRELASACHTQLHHVKPHGALYNDMAKDADLARDVVLLIKEIDPALRVFGLAGSETETVCRADNIPFIAEGFADRRYVAPDRLQSRSEAGAVLTRPTDVLTQIDNFLTGKVTLADGTTAPLPVRTLCLHSDTDGAVALSRLIYRHLTEQNVRIAAPV